MLLRVSDRQATPESKVSLWFLLWRDARGKVAVKYTIPKTPGKAPADFMISEPVTIFGTSGPPTGNSGEDHAPSAAILVKEILHRCDLLGAFTEIPGQITRPFLCPSAHDVHAALSEWLTDAGCSEVRVDAIGNLIGRRTVPNAPALVMGSHLDTVPNAGRYDGILGVLLGIATLEALWQTPLPFALEVVGFSEEEGVRFGVPYLGSRAYAGSFDSALGERRDANGVSVAEAISAFGLDPEKVPGAARPSSELLGYIEAHVEQGPVLERGGKPLGVADAIAGQSRLVLRFTGRAGHAGTTPMGGGNRRRDALAGAAEFILAAESAGESTPDLVATVGRINALPGAGNVIPGDVELSLDVRHAEDVVRTTVVQELRQKASQIALQRGLQFTVLSEMHQAAVPLDANFCARLAQAVETVTEQPCPRLISGAGHDAGILAPYTPTALLFVRSPKAGLSHHPDEAVGLEDVEAALRVLVAFVLRLAEDFEKSRCL